MVPACSHQSRRLSERARIIRRRRARSIHRSHSDRGCTCYLVPCIRLAHCAHLLAFFIPIRVEGTPTSVHEGLASLLRTNAHQAFLFALSNFTPEESITFKAAFARGLRVLAVAFAECVGPSQWGLKPESSKVRHEAKFALETLFKVSHFLTVSRSYRVY
jgi:hypothetical protein